jgi:hypothetical protein
MEEGDVKNIEHQESVLELWTQAVEKLRMFVLVEVLPELKATPEKTFEIKTLMSVNAMLFMPPLKDFLTNYYDQIMNKNVDFFRVLFPPEFQNVQISDHLQEKGVRFAKVFKSLLDDLENE